MHILLMIVVVIIFLFILYKPIYAAHVEIKTAQDAYNATVDDRIEYMENVLKRRQYVPLETLPSIRFNTELGTINDGERKCLSVPVYVGSDNIPNFDCTLVCDDPAAVYFFVGEFDKFLVNGQMLTRGGYCTTNSVPRNCNRETSIILHSLNQWTCIAEDPRYYAGPMNMVQIAGRQHATRIAPGEITKNILYDNLLKMEVDVSRNTFRRDWDETMPDGSRRFQVICNALDDRYNQMFVNPMNPIECLPNTCTSVRYVHRDVKPNFETGECECGDFNVTRLTHIVPGDRTSMCASIVDRFQPFNNSHVFRVECVNMNTLISEYDPNMLLCPGSQFDSNNDNAFNYELPGTYVFSWNGIHEPTHRFYLDTRSRIVYNIVNPVPT
nr:per os infectivity factor 2 [Chrysodeixis includens nucleopolyhedrovirus]AGN49339.1 per os infectivity factor 2 [Chrysodeixis includens nucleopolyhedrovirus]AGN49340.1 per os infectivity factor 2 [Chrysodeixis includens nucleopolyhedrovirus]AOL57142.1 PIF-2 [Chrysodeixis includens nucleopolyhedrovirus]AOL57283.1 PIF-2 [Chrysodeixis includens nucleopolyhedrovirus]